MSDSLSLAVEPADHELIAAVRSGDAAAMDALYRRHRPAMERVARALDAQRGDDLVAEAFSRVFDAIRAGRGPRDNVAGYLASTIRNLHTDQLRAQGRELPASDRPWVLDEPTVDEVLDPIDLDRAEQALSALPERWREVLWYLEVEGRKPAEVAAQLGVTAPRVSALAYRAREGLRRSYLDRHLATADARQCRWTRERLSAYVRGGLSEAAHEKVRRHLDVCADCMLQHASLVEVNTRLGVWFWPLAITGFAVLRPDGWPPAVLASGASGTAAGTAAGVGVPRPKGRSLGPAVTTAGVVGGIAAAAVTAFALGAFAPTTEVSEAAPPPTPPSPAPAPVAPEADQSDDAPPVVVADAPALRPASSEPTKTPPPDPEPEEPQKQEPQEPAITSASFGIVTVSDVDPHTGERVVTLPVDLAYQGDLDATKLTITFDMGSPVGFNVASTNGWTCVADEELPNPRNFYVHPSTTCTFEWVPDTSAPDLTVGITWFDASWTITEPFGSATLAAGGFSDRHDF